MVKMATSKRLFQEVLRLYDWMVEDQVKIEGRAVWSCLVFSASETKKLDLCAEFFDKLRACKDGTPSPKDYVNIIRARASQGRPLEALALLDEMKELVGMDAPDHIAYNTVLSARCVQGRYGRRTKFCK